ncbi:NADPH oxidase activator 1 [Varanus komodoensis]|uniref:NADPH oxidase activator 1 n=1 Tax=Varanus komodoensis TaxID=61221 RepID=UPI001CF7D68E|nr:NADPH oxidase activator 1 [Varanus komodoensis]
MGYRELVRLWNEGVLALEKGDRAAALRLFRGIAGPTSKIHFNIGSVLLLQGDLDRALEAFDQAVCKDSCLAVGFFQRGYVCLRLERYEDALNDFQSAWMHLRKNMCIDYKQLGLKFVLFAWEVLHNMAAAHCWLGRWQDARRVLEEAGSSSLKGPRAQLRTALEQVQDHLFLEPRSVPLGEVFRPPAKDVDELEEKDFLGQPKVISSAFEEHSLNAFRGLQPRIRNGGPPPPGKAPPSWVHGTPKLLESSQPQGQPEPQVCRAADANPERDLAACSARAGTAFAGTRPVLLKLHATYAVRVEAGVPPTLAGLRLLLQEECQRQAARMTLRYQLPESDELAPIHNDEDLWTAWEGAQGDQLDLWAHGKEDRLDRPVLYHMVACHSYAGQAQEDLNFTEGDTLEVLAEVNEEWLEGRCQGAVGIFPKCFAVRKDVEVACL